MTKAERGYWPQFTDDDDWGSYWLVAQAGLVARVFINHLERNKVNSLVYFSLVTAGYLHNQARGSCEIIHEVCVHLTWGQGCELP